MPIYEYKCPKCKVEMEVRQGFNDPAPEHPVPLEGELDEAAFYQESERLGGVLPIVNCDGVMEKQISKGSFQLKGSGWYKDGY